MVRARSAAWMVEDWPEGTFGREMQVLATAILRLQVVIAFAPLRRFERRLQRAVHR